MLQSYIPPTEKLIGIVERVTFHSQTSGFCVLRLRVKGHRNLVTLVGTAVSVNMGESVEAQGSWLHDSTHGTQFRASNIQLIAPTTVLGIEKYLGSGMIKGIGPHFARKLVAAFAEDTFEVIEHAPEKLLQLPGIGEKRQQQILAAWQDQKAVRNIMVFLQSYQISTTRAVRIYKTYGDQAIEKIQENPYRLAQDIYGIGFKTADHLARQMNIPEDSPLRATAGIQHVMQTLRCDGHCAVPIISLQTQTEALLSMSVAIISAAIEQAILDGHLIKSELAGNTVVALSSLYQAEVSVAQQLLRLLKAHLLPWGVVDTVRLSQWIQQADMTLSSSQTVAITQALQSKVFILTGGPGVGKTTVIKSLLDILQKNAQFSPNQASLAKNQSISGVRIALCAPTGRAAKRLSETSGWAAKTIHRLLEFEPKRLGFKYQQDNLLPVDLIVVDEVSMLDIVLMNQLLKAIPTTAALWLIGDSDQLPSVGPGRVLADLIEAQRIPAVCLTEIFRQAATSQIIVNAHRINQGLMPLLLAKEALSDFYFIEADTPEIIQHKILELVAVRIPRRFKCHPIHDIQVLTPMNRGGAGAHILNSLLQSRLNPQVTAQIERFGSRFAVGDKVIQHVNNYDKVIFNGDIGYIDTIDIEASHLQVNFEGRTVDYSLHELDELNLAYAMSIHKSQGSEYPVVVIPIAMQHYRMLARNLLYTGITRGKQLVILVGQKKALAIAVHTTNSHQRLTQLQEWLKA